MTLTEFVTARLDDDQLAAEAAGSAPWRQDVPRQVHVSAPLRASHKHEFGNQGYISSVDHAEHAEHIARHDPARVLAQVAAMRAIVGEHGDQHECPDIFATYWPYLGCQTIRHLAAIWRDHDDYDPAWAPDACGAQGREDRGRR